MKTVEFSVTDANLNSYAWQNINLEQVFSKPRVDGSSLDTALRPRELMIYNDQSGIAIEFLLFATPEEENEMLTHPQFFAPIKVPAGQILNYPNMPESTRMKVRGVTGGTAVAALRVIGVDYTNR